MGSELLSPCRAARSRRTPVLFVQPRRNYHTTLVEGMPRFPPNRPRRQRCLLRRCGLKGPECGHAPTDLLGGAGHAQPWPLYPGGCRASPPTPASPEPGAETSRPFRPPYRPLASVSFPAVIALFRAGHSSGLTGERGGGRKEAPRREAECHPTTVIQHCRSQPRREAQQAPSERARGAPGGYYGPVHKTTGGRDRARQARVSPRKGQRHAGAGKRANAMASRQALGPGACPRRRPAVTLAPKDAGVSRAWPGAAGYVARERRPRSTRAPRPQAPPGSAITAVPPPPRWAPLGTEHAGGNKCDPAAGLPLSVRLHELANAGEHVRRVPPAPADPKGKGLPDTRAAPGPRSSDVTDRQARSIHDHDLLYVPREVCARGAGQPRISDGPPPQMGRGKAGIGRASRTGVASTTAPGLRLGSVVFSRGQ